MVYVECIKCIKVAKKICQFMLKVCLYKCKESSDLNFRGKLKAIYSAYLIINIVRYKRGKSKGVVICIQAVISYDRDWWTRRATSSR